MHKFWASSLTVAFLLMSGCTAPIEGSDDDLPPKPDEPGSGGTSSPGPGFAPQSGFSEDHEEGLHLSVQFEACKSTYCLDGLAENEGTVTYYVSNICVSPFSDKMESEGKTVQQREPVAHCEAFGLAPFKPGATMTANMTWDGQLWNEETGELEEAPQGSYQWTMVFEAYEHENGGEKIVLEATVNVIMGET